MGLTYADLKLTNGGEFAAANLGLLEKEKIHSMNVRALADSGAAMMAVPDHIAVQLNLPYLEHREFNLADGTSTKLPVVGPVLVEFENRKTVCFAASTKDKEVLLGAIPIEDLDVVLNPRKQTIEVNPENPYLPRMSMK